MAESETYIPFYTNICAKKVIFDYLSSGSDGGGVGNSIRHEITSSFNGCAFYEEKILLSKLLLIIIIILFRKQNENERALQLIDSLLLLL